MNKNKRYARLFLGLISVVFALSSCTGEEEPAVSGQTGEVWLSVSAPADMEITTKALPNFDVNDFNLTLTRGETAIFTSQKYGNLAGSPITCSVGTGYLLTAESCTEAEAESANNGWGKARVTGQEPFEVKNGETTTVAVECALANTGVSVGFSDYVRGLFSDYSVTIHAADAESRQLTFSQNTYENRSAYFNVGEEKRALQYTVSLSRTGQSEPYVYTKSLTLDPSSSYRLTVRLDDETQSRLQVGITVDGTLLREDTLTHLINPYK